LSGIMVDGLTRIGDSAIHESLEWKRNGEITEEKFFAVLEANPTLLASEALWSCYHLAPPASLKARWAENWASRLGHEDIDNFLRSILMPGNGVTDSLAWPYRRNDRSALAALTVEVFGVLRGLYCKRSDIQRQELLFQQFSFRLRIPLLLNCEND